MYLLKPNLLFQIVCVQCAPVFIANEVQFAFNISSSHDRLLMIIAKSMQLN